MLKVSIDISYEQSVSLVVSIPMWELLEIASFLLLMALRCVAQRLVFAIIIEDLDDTDVKRRRNLTLSVVTGNARGVFTLIFDTHFTSDLSINWTENETTEMDIDQNEVT